MLLKELLFLSLEKQALEESFKNFSLGKSSILAAAFKHFRNTIGFRSRADDSKPLDNSSIEEILSMPMWASMSMIIVSLKNKPFAIIQFNGKNFFLAYDFTEVPDQLQKKMAGKNWVEQKSKSNFHLSNINQSDSKTSHQTYDWVYYYLGNAGPAGKYQTSSNGKYDSTIHKVTGAKLKAFLKAVAKVENVEVKKIFSEYCSPDLVDAVKSGDVHVLSSGQIQHEVNSKNSPLYFVKGKLDGAIQSLPKVNQNYRAGDNAPKYSFDNVTFSQEKMPGAKVIKVMNRQQNNYREF